MTPEERAKHLFDTVGIHAIERAKAEEYIANHIRYAVTAAVQAERDRCVEIAQHAIDISYNAQWIKQQIHG